MTIQRQVRGQFAENASVVRTLFDLFLCQETSLLLHDFDGERKEKETEEVRKSQAYQPEESSRHSVAYSGEERKSDGIQFQ